MLYASGHHAPLSQHYAVSTLAGTLPAANHNRAAYLTRVADSVAGKPIDGALGQAVLAQKL